jgi:hypothetical protein
MRRARTASANRTIERRLPSEFARSERPCFLDQRVDELIELLFARRADELLPELAFAVDPIERRPGADAPTLRNRPAAASRAIRAVPAAAPRDVRVLQAGLQRREILRAASRA